MAVGAAAARLVGQLQQVREGLSVALLQQSMAAASSSSSAAEQLLASSRRVQVGNWSCVSMLLRSSSRYI